MKLWLRISLFCALALILIVTACCTLLLAQSRDALLSAETLRAQQKQRDLQASFAAMTSCYLTEELGQTARASLATYCFTRFADEAGMLVCAGQILSARLDAHPETLLPLDTNAVNGQRTLETAFQGKNLLLVGGRTQVLGIAYDIYVLEDVSPVYAASRRMAGRFALIAASGMLMGAALILPLVRRMTRPLAALGSAARRIADGQYHERVDICGRDEVGALAEDFNRMTEAVEAHIDALTETAERQRLFISGVTHEYKTPLTSVLIHADTLQNTRLRPADRERAIGYIRSQCAHLEKLTQRLLQLLVLDETTLIDCDVSTLLDAVKESTADMLAARGTPLVVECDMPSARMDSSLMRSLLINLVDNASKASAPGQTIRLSAHNGCFTVSDQGSGIHASDLPRVTEPFYMADRSRSKRQGGSGLGLALVKRITDAHGATLSIESEPQAGTVVTVRLPVTKL